MQAWVLRCALCALSAEHGRAVQGWPCAGRPACPACRPRWTSPWHHLPSTQPSHPLCLRPALPQTRHSLEIHLENGSQLELCPDEDDIPQIFFNVSRTACAWCLHAAPCAALRPPPSAAVAATLAALPTRPPPPCPALPSVPCRRAQFSKISAVEDAPPNTMLDIVGVVDTCADWATIVRKDGTETQVRAQRCGGGRRAAMLQVLGASHECPPARPRSA